ncbi:hypothetical protein LQZ24_05865 [Fructobacillus sp. M1-13]|uniref:Uncharacterized protein n=1 Tax=Fructobacillus papyriferae TaxID=2713171 RepID=A0ABS5QSQ2_9LACO|nr:hypothetical protein [Fructobacillus papyriferae]MBS9334992.1 hypothetical protein [Fructobacillus papyriferae]MCD2159522.1 hypothetical protein [Fructobacillus papyriferae]
MQWYFKYNPNTFEFIPGAIRAEEQPENTTDIEPTGFYGLPKWNPSTNSWTGQSIGDYLAEQKANAKQQLDPQQQQLNTIANQLLKQNIALSQRVSALEREAK